MPREQPLRVIGHLNPDTDAIASAVGYAWLLRTRDEAEALPARAGPLNPQTAWALAQCHLDPPEYLADASPRFAAVARQLAPLTEANTLRQAWAGAAHAGCAPVLQPDGTPAGLVTSASVFAYFSGRLSAGDQVEQMTVERVLSVSCLAAADRDAPRFRQEARIRDARDAILRDERDDFWVVDEAGKYVGVCRTPDVLNPPRLRLILVDHNEAAQAVPALDEAEIVEVLDHHRLGNPPTRLPIPFHVEPVGSTSTLVAERIAAAGRTPPPPIAAILFAGLLSDTLALRSPTTTGRDRAAAARLSEWAFAPHGPLAGALPEAFGRQLLEAGAGLTSRRPEEIVSADLKVYEAGGVKFAVAQVEVASLVELTPERVEELCAALESMRAGRGLDLAVLMVTDIVLGSARLLMTGAVERLRGLPYVHLGDGTLDAPGVVSRKKQLLPAILGLLQG